MKEQQPRKAEAEGLLPVGDLKIPCYVLEDGTRLISQRGMQSTVGMSSGGSGRAHRIAEFSERLELRINKTNELSVRLKTPVLFTPFHGGKPAYGYEATCLIDYCELILRCREDGLMTGVRYS